MRLDGIEAMLEQWLRQRTHHKPTTLENAVLVASRTSFSGTLYLAQEKLPGKPFRYEMVETVNVAHLAWNQANDIRRYANENREPPLLPDTAFRF
jgi:hypothetical protein